METQLITPNICIQCGYEWMPRIMNSKPKCCPSCKRYDYWDKGEEADENG